MPMKIYALYATVENCNKHDIMRYFTYILCKHTCFVTTTDMPCEKLLDVSRVVVTCLSNLHFNDERTTQSLADYRIAKRYTASSRFGRSCHIREKDRRLTFGELSASFRQPGVSMLVGAAPLLVRVTLNFRQRGRLAARATLD